MLVVEDGAVSRASVLELSGADARTRRTTIEEWSGAAARGARGVGAAAADERRAARRDAQRRPRLEPDRRADGEADGPAGQDVLGRLRGGRREQRARRRPLRRRTTSAPTTTSSSSRSLEETSRSLEDLRLAPRRAARRPLVARLPRALRARAQHVTVALSGQGADELLGGYRKHRAAAIAGTLAARPGPLRRGRPRCSRPHGAEQLRRPVATLAAPDPAERLLVERADTSTGAEQAGSCAVRSPSLDGNARCARSS